MHVVDAADRLTGEVEHDVAFGEARGFGRAAGHQVGDHRGARRCQLEAARKPRVERHALRRDAEPTASIPIAKQIPCAAPIIAVLMPTARPLPSTSGPPELPGLSGASGSMT